MKDFELLIITVYVSVAIIIFHIYSSILLKPITDLYILDRFTYCIDSSNKGSYGYGLKQLDHNVLFLQKSLYLINYKRLNSKVPLGKTLQQFGAKGDGVTDDTQAIIKALNSPTQLIYARRTTAFYKISNMIVISNVSKKKLVATGAKFLNSDTTKATFLFQDARNIEIYGGQFGYIRMPNANGGNSQHVFQFDRCQDVLVDKVHIVNSPEMGIAITNSNRVKVQNSLIEHTFRDGTYAHYSANVQYINNVYKNIKDDAMSFHDYGINSQKEQLLKFGYKQATNLIAKGNVIENSYQGFSSVSASNVQVINNKISNTVLAGISIFNSKEMYPNGTAFSKNIKILYNTLNNICKSTIINNKKYDNYGQSATGRAAIFIGSLGDNNQINRGETKRLSNITIKGNKITNSGAHGFWGRYVDSLNLTNNNFVNCSGAVAAQSLTGDVVEVSEVTKFFGYNNQIIDNRSKVLHRHGYAINNVTGRMGKWKIKGFVISEKSLPAKDSLRLLINQLK